MQMVDQASNQPYKGPQETFYKDNYDKQNKGNKPMTKTQINTFITTNSTFFAEDATFTNTDLAKWFNLPMSNNINRNNMLLLSAYTKLNKLLKTRGLVIKSKGYYTEFSVRGGAAATSQVNSLKRTGVNKIASATTLATGIAEYSSSWPKKISKKRLKAIPHTASIFGA